MDAERRQELYEKQVDEDAAERRAPKRECEHPRCVQLAEWRDEADGSWWCDAHAVGDRS